MEKMNIEVELVDGSEVEVELDVSSLGDLGQYDENEMDEELKNLIKQQYPELTGKVTTIYC